MKLTKALPILIVICLLALYFDVVRYVFHDPLPLPPDVYEDAVAIFQKQRDTLPESKIRHEGYFNYEVADDTFAKTKLIFKFYKPDYPDIVNKIRLVKEPGKYLPILRRVQVLTTSSKKVYQTKEIVLYWRKYRGIWEFQNCLIDAGKDTDLFEAKYYYDFFVSEEQKLIDFKIKIQYFRQGIYSAREYLETFEQPFYPHFSYDTYQDKPVLMVVDNPKIPNLKNHENIISNLEKHSDEEENGLLKFKMERILVNLGINIENGLYVEYIHRY